MVSRMCSWIESETPKDLAEAMAAGRPLGAGMPDHSGLNKIYMRQLNRCGLSLSVRLITVASGVACLWENSPEAKTV